MPRLPTRLLALLLGLLSGTALAQSGPGPELVPAEHPVYGFLQDQRVAGRLPEFYAEQLPTDRAEVARLLDSLAVRGPLRGGERSWLRTYRQEFLEPLERVASVVGKGDAGLLDPDAERFLAYERSADWRAAVQSGGAFQYRATRDEGLSQGGLARVASATFQGNWRGIVGLYSATDVGFQITGDRRALLRDPETRTLYQVARDPLFPQGSFDRTTAAVRLRGGPFAGEIGRGRLLAGPTADRSVTLADGADYLSYVRLSFDTPVLRYRFVHAALTERPRTVANPDETFFFESVERYLALHRADVAFGRWGRFGFTEMVVYGGRGPELGYLNPLFPIKPAEHALWDRDNTLFTLDGTLRPVRGVEVYGSVLVDDLVTSAPLRNYGTKWAGQAGAFASAGRWLPGTTLFAEYTFIDPFTYTHRFVRDGVNINAYTQNGFGLGHPLGPNADQWLAGARAWLPGRMQARAAVRRVREGLNPVDPETGAVRNVGRDVAFGAIPPGPFPDTPFLDGDVVRGTGLALDLSWEPARGVLLRGVLDAERRDTRPSRFFSRLAFSMSL